MRAESTRELFRRVRAVALGLFFVLPITSCIGRPTPRALARAYDRQDGTGLYTWLVDHEPSALVAWEIPAERLQAVVPRARIEAAASDDPCAQAARAHAALVTRLSIRDTEHRRDRALDCGIPLYRDPRDFVIAPR